MGRFAVRFAGVGKTAEGDDLGDDAGWRGEGGRRRRMDVDEGGGVVFWRFGFWIGRLVGIVVGRHGYLVNEGGEVELCTRRYSQTVTGHADIGFKTRQFFVS